MRTPVASLELAAQARQGSRRAMARLISRAEAADPECRPALAELYRHTGDAHVIGITGVPGSGKSTLVQRLAQLIRRDGRTVAVIAIDPSSPYSGGSILGDRVRMSELAMDAGAFIRSMATRGTLGGLARASLDAVDVLDAGGFDVILLETVGVGQDEVDVVRATHTTVVVSAPGLGDDIQAIKAGVLEIADIHVVSKADRADANRTIIELKGLMTLGLHGGGAGGWQCPVIATSSERGTGIEDLLGALDRHREHLQRTGELELRKARIAETRTIKIAEDIVRADFLRQREGRMASLLDRVIRRETDPHAAAVELLTALGDNPS
jgi:LAO/AO transport system kinase